MSGTPHWPAGSSEKPSFFVMTLRGLGLVQIHEFASKYLPRLPVSAVRMTL